MKLLVVIAIFACLPVRAETPLIEAIQKGEPERVRTLIKNQTDLNATTADGATALHWAIQKNDAATADLLLSAGASATATNRYGVTPLWIACQNGNSRIVEKLLSAGADANTRLRDGETVLMTAARTGNLTLVKALLAAGADVNSKEKRGQTAVMWAAAEGHAEVLEVLIKAGADFRKPLDGGFTPLFFAVREGKTDVVKALLKAGVDVNEAMDPKRRAGRGPQDGMTPLLMAVENGHFELAIDLVKAGANPNDQRGGYTALHNISWVRKPDNGESEEGMPPPAGSGKLSSLEFVREIVKLGADVNARIEKGRGGLGVLNRKGATPFLLAAKTADVELLKVLYALGADPTITTSDGVTPLIAAAGLGTLAAGEVAGTEDEVLAACEWLLKVGQDVNAVDKNGETAMHAAAYKNLPKVVEFLAANGAKIDIWNQKDVHGWTPLLIAEGFRPGNFKPSFETIAAIHKVMLAAGMTPPPPTSAEGINNSDFGPREKKYFGK
ncbi:MAG TPA: ankyrin repeat domain-containing protein [Candidatus Kapabacteria bacterium]|nr:ankyrin repeat domain-containing protein [Candidatus Kapabacteria bacterium]